MYTALSQSHTPGPAHDPILVVSVMTPSVSAEPQQHFNSQRLLEDLIFTMARAYLKITTENDTVNYNYSQSGSTRYVERQ